MSSISPFVYTPGRLIEDYRVLKKSAENFGLLEKESFDVGVKTDELPARIERVLKGVRIEFRDAPMPGNTDPKVVAFGKDGKAVSEDSAPSGIRLADGNIPTAWFHVIDGYVNGVDLLREVGSLIEYGYHRWMGIVLKPGMSSSEVELYDGKTIVMRREDAVSMALESAGYKYLDHTRLYINSHAAVLQALSAALLLRVDVSWVLLDVLDRAVSDRAMHQLFEGMSNKSGVDFRDRAELQDYTDANFSLYEGPEDPYYANLYSINAQARYYARHMNLVHRARALGATPRNPQRAT